MSSIGTGSIVGIAVGVVVGVVMCSYMCCCRKWATMKQTQKLMDATNLMHAQEPQGTISPGVLPDASSAPPPVPGLSAHPRPGTAMTMSGESLDRTVPGEVKGAEQSSGRWEPRPFVPPTGSSFVSGGTSGTISESSSSGPVWQTGSALITTSPAWSNPTPVAAGSSTGSITPGHFYSQSGHVAGGSHISRQERHPQGRDSSDIALTSSVHIPSNSRNYHELDPNLMPPRTRLNPHEPIIS
ncbi:hypothetical protein BGX26_005802 [Mortierella sp. AD094]|nr:hypothetical protein BGX26_005802 [Mortierella sp. AD094]